MKHRFLVTFSVIGLVVSAREAAAQESITLGGRSVVVWAPRAASGKQPVLIFSHGFGGCAVQSKFLTEKLAQHGYWVFAPNHQDARCGGSRSGGGRPDAPFRKPEDWSDKSFVNRRDDIRAMIDALGSDARYATRVDLTRLGLVGHSLGGYTVVGLAGGWPSWKTGAPKAVLALSPYLDPYLVHGTLGGVSAPVMFQGGTVDFGITPSIRKQGGVYDATPKPKYFVELKRAGHLAWTDLRPALHDDVNDYAIAFLDHYVLGASATALLTRPSDAVSVLWYESELGSRSR
jgi:predicted dienelactone hydrolase